MMSKKVALVIGGTGGIGSQISRIFSEHEIKTYAVFHKNCQTAEKLKTELKNFKALHCDIKDKKLVNKMIKNILGEEATIDILVNSVTTNLKLKTFDMLTAKEFRNDMETILFGSINIFKAITPIMKKNKSGLIIIFLTKAIIGHPPARMSSYITAKSALLGLTKSLSAELAPFSIKILGISPSFVETDLIKAFPAKLLEIEREKQPDKKFIQPHDIAKLVLGIVQNPDQYRSGENIIINTKENARAFIK